MIKYYMNNPCTVLREINEEFSEVSVHPQFDEDMNGGEWCTECMVGNQGTPSTHTCEQYQDVLEAIRGTEPQMIVIVENRLLADERVEFKALRKARDLLAEFSEKKTVAINKRNEAQTEAAQSRDILISTAFEANSAIDRLAQTNADIYEAESKLFEINESLSTAKGRISVGGITLSMTVGNLKQLIEDSVMLNLLQQGGVDNWEWYGESLGGSENVDNLVAQEISGLSIEDIK